MSKFHIAIIIPRHHHPHDKLKHWSHFFFLVKRAGAFLETYPEREIDIARLYLHVYIQNGLDGSATAKNFFFSARPAFVVRTVRIEKQRLQFPNASTAGTRHYANYFGIIRFNCEKFTKRLYLE